MSLEVIPIILFAQVYAPWKAMNLPSLGRLTVGSAKRRPRGMYADEWGVYGHGFGEPELKETPAQLLIRGTAGSGPGQRSWHLCIDLEEGTVGAADWGDLTFYRYGGSGEIGMFLFGLPGLILTSPLWITSNFVQRLISRLTPLSTEMWAVWFKLRGQLDAGDRQVLWEALRKYCAGIENSHNLRRGAEYEAKRRQEKIDAQFANWKDDYIDGPFMARLEHGTAEPDEVMQDYEDWQHRQPVDRPIRAHEWLGMSESEFLAWYRQEKTVLQLLEERQRVQVSEDEAHQG